MPHGMDMGVVPEEKSVSQNEKCDQNPFYVGMGGHCELWQPQHGVNREIIANANGIDVYADQLGRYNVKEQHCHKEGRGTAVAQHIPPADQENNKQRQPENDLVEHQCHLTAF